MAGYYFKKRDIDFEIFEKSDRIGGKIQSLKIENNIFETAANSILMTPKLKQFFEGIDLHPISTNKGLKRLIYKDNTITSFPFVSYLELPKLFFKTFKKCPTNIESLTVKDFWSPLLGDKNCSQVLTPILNGIYATPCEELKFMDIFNTEFSFENKTYFSYIKFLKSKMEGLKSVSFNGGMEELPKRLAALLKGHISLNSEINDMPKNTLICTDSSKLLKQGNTSIYSHSIIATPIDNLKNSYGILFSGRDDILGILCNHHIFSFNKSPSYTIVSKTLLSTEELRKKLKLIFQQEVSISHFKAFSWQHGLPLYNQSRQDKLNSLDLKNFAYFGNYTSGISLRSLIEQTI